MDRVERLLRLHGLGDPAPIVAELQRDDRLRRLGFAPPTPRPPDPFEARTRALTREHVAALAADGVIDPYTGERISRDEHGHTWRYDPTTGRWWRYDTAGRRVYDDDN